MFDRTKRAIDRANRIADAVGNAGSKVNRALTTSENQTLRGKAVESVKGKLPSGPPRCACGKLAKRNSDNCGKPACIRAQAAEMAHIHTRNTNGEKHKPTGKAGRK